MSERFTTEIPVRYSDVDTYGHVNNATYATFLEEARIDYLEALLGDEDLTSAVDSGLDDGEDSGGGELLGMVVANMEIDFQRTIEATDAVTVAVSATNLGNSSFTLEYEIRTEDGVHASAETTMVAYDRIEREARPLPDHWRSAVEEFEGLEAD